MARPLWLLLALPCPALAQGVFRGPYLNHPTGDAITVVWESPGPSSGVVRYGVGSPSRTAQSGPSATHHEVRLTGLAALAPPGSELLYELEVGGTVYTGSFRTMPPAGAPLRFIVYGDNRSSPQQHQQVVDALLREGPAHFAINTGDLVSSGEREADWDAFFPVAAPFLARTPLYVAIGNHEVELGRWDVTRRLFVLPTDVPPASNQEGYYRVVYGNVELIVVNVETDSLYTLGILQGGQEPWLESVLAERTPGVEHRFLFLHQGPYSSKVGRNGNFWLRQWLDRLRQAEIDVIFSGHDHYAERGWAEPGIYYVIHGGGGAPLYDTLGPRPTADHTIVYGESRLGYAVVEVNGPRAEVTLKGLANEVVDQFRYGDTAQPGCTTAADCGAAPANACGGGAWECHRSACRYTCDSGAGALIQCATDNGCANMIGTTCAGTPRCEHPSLNPLTWFCRCELPPDCTQDADCQGRPSPIPGCGGSWACVTEQCEFTTTTCGPVDGGMDAGTSTVAGGDAAQSPADASAGADAATSADAAARDDAARDGGSSGALPAQGCGCHAHHRPSSPWPTAGLALLALLELRRRRR